MRACLRYYYLVSIGIDDEIRVVCDHDDLAFMLCVTEQFHKFVLDGFWIQVLLGLIYDQGAIVRVIEGKIEE